MKKFVWIAALALGLGIAADASAIDAIRKLGNARVSGYERRGDGDSGSGTGGLFEE